jgi:outer membrane receptor protein involved in Fe transport
MNANWLRDFDFTDRESWWSTDPQSLEDENYEIRLTSAQDGAISWVVGASYYTMDYTQSGNGGTAITRLPVGPNIFIPLTFNEQLGQQRQSDLYGRLRRRDLRSLPTWSLSVEGRWQEDELEKGQIIARQAGLPHQGHVGRLAPRVIIQWQPTPETNVYASYAVGVLPGDINAEFIYGPDNMRTEEQIASVRDQAQNGADPYLELGIATGSPGIPEVTDFLDREKLDSFEIGWKQTWAQGMITTAMAVYYMEWENQKGRLSAPVVDFNGNTNAPVRPRHGRRQWKCLCHPRIHGPVLQ